MKDNKEIIISGSVEQQSLIKDLRTQLQAEFGKKGFEPRSIWRMMQFAQDFPDIKIVSAVSTQSQLSNNI